jgi:hypothetical protein
MEVVAMKDIEYTADDLKVLAEMSEPDSPYPVKLAKMGYDPVQFKAFMQERLPKAFKLMYQTDLDDLLLQINNPMIQRIFSWRTSVNK